MDGEGDTSQCELTCPEECVTYKPVTYDKSGRVVVVHLSLSFILSALPSGTGQVPLILMHVEGKE